MLKNKFVTRVIYSLVIIMPSGRILDGDKLIDFCETLSRASQPRDLVHSSLLGNLVSLSY